MNANKFGNHLTYHSQNGFAAMTEPSALRKAVSRVDECVENIYFRHSVIDSFV